MSEPIVAIATASGRGAIGIVRISGHALAPLAAALCGGLRLEPRHATLTSFLDRHGETIDRGLAIHFPAPHSYTGEDVLELQAHGGPVVMQLLLARCLEAAAEGDSASGRSRLGGLRLARPGEFTERAFLNDKLDLAQAEAVADLIDASTEAAARSAARSLDGAFSREIGVLAGKIVELRLLVEATLDFPEEEIEFLERAGARQWLADAKAQIEAVLATARQGVLLHEGIRVVLAGQPNVGKSSLLNALAGAELAIVTDIPGTTRDKVGETIQIEGVPVHVVDTAGLREAGDAVEAIGVARSWAAIGDADAIVFLRDLTRIGDADYDAGEAPIAARLAAAAAAGRVLEVFNKSDAAAPEQIVAQDAQALVVSAVTRAGLETLRRALLARAGWQAAGEGVFHARARHVDALQRAGEHLAAAEAHAGVGDQALELVAEELRSAHDALGEITGAFSADDLLGAIFGRFCIGK
ncbi:MAG: tRNA uridine-5-carboxymethylaminomethyl(34) synthesis GTPase MnmE [Burkholderiales bacterium]|nr:tRNA uridine-5-carboxymethylaminomethyl(34) synthesis GTPase MnmE [Burkholderiales bacterium]